MCPPILVPQTPPAPSRFAHFFIFLVACRTVGPGGGSTWQWLREWIHSRDIPHSITHPGLASWHWVLQDFLFSCCEASSVTAPIQELKFIPPPQQPLHPSLPFSTNSIAGRPPRPKNPKQPRLPWLLGAGRHRAQHGAQLWIDPRGMVRAGCASHQDQQHPVGTPCSAGPYLTSPSLHAAAAPGFCVLETAAATASLILEAVFLYCIFVPLFGEVLVKSLLFYIYINI